MSFMSRFLKPKQDEEDPLENIDGESLGDDGLLMSAVPQPQAADEDDPGVDVDAAAPSTVAADAGAAADEVVGDATPEIDDESEEDATPTPVQTVAAAPESGGDDAMSLFRASKGEVIQNELTKGLEDVPVQELLQELRELREMLGITGPVAVEAEEQD